MARTLAAKVVSVSGTESMSEAELAQAKRLVDDCDEVIVCRESFGSWEKMGEQLLQYIRQKR